MNAGPHSPSDFRGFFALGIFLNLGFVAVEAGAGLLTGSLTLLTDAGHNLSDVAGLGLAWGAAVLAARRPTKRRTYGWRKLSILAALFNAVILLVALGGIGYEAIRRLGSPAPVSGLTVMVVAGIGVLVNGATALLFRRGRKNDLNVRGAFLHMAGDAAISAGVVLTGALIALTGRMWLDPLVSLASVALIPLCVWGLLRQSFDLALDAVPGGIQPSEVRRYLRGLAGVEEVCDLHIWALSTTQIALTAHLVKPDPAGDDETVARAVAGLRERFGIGHATIQMERQAWRAGRICRHLSATPAARPPLPIAASAHRRLVLVPPAASAPASLGSASLASASLASASYAPASLASASFASASFAPGSTPSPLAPVSIASASAALASSSPSHVAANTSGPAMAFTGSARSRGGSGW